MFEAYQPKSAGDHPAWDELATSLVADAAQISAATCALLVKLGRFDRLAAWEGDDYRTPTAWMAWHFGMHHRVAYEYLRVARCLPGLPVITGAFSRGELSFFQVRSLARVATAETEDCLVEIARAATGTQLTTLVAAYRRVLESAANQEANRKHALRYFRCSFDDDGFLVLSGRLGPEEGAVFRDALNTAVDQMTRASKDPVEPCLMFQAHPEDRPPGESKDYWAARQADALVVMAESFLSTGPACRKGSDRQQVVIHVDAEALSGHGSDRGGSDRDASDPFGPPGGLAHCEIEAGPAIAPESARRVACDAALVTLVEDAEGNPLSVGRKTRKISPALRRALASRDQGCRFPGCGQQLFTEAHHLRHWAAGGETSLTNLATLCWYHHRLVHEGGYRVTAEGDRLTFVRPNGSTVPAHPPRGGPHDAQLDVGIDPSTVGSNYSGQHLDAAYAVGCVAQHDPRLTPASGGRQPPD